jgi:hypothetical protein
MTLATGTSVTVTVAVPVFPSLVAVIVAVPSATPVTTPLVETIAIEAPLVVHVTVRPVSVVPFASFVVAVKLTVAPTEMLGVKGLTVTVATGAGVTVTVADPDLPSLVAVTVAVPGLTPVTTPVVETVATPDALVVHVTVRPVSVLLLASLRVAVSGEVVPCTTETELGATVTEATGIGLTVTLADPDLPSLVAVIVALPLAIPVTTPLETVAMAVLLDVHVMVRSVTTVPPTSFTTAASVVVCPTVTLAVAG